MKAHNKYTQSNLTPESALELLREAAKYGDKNAISFLEEHNKR